MSGGEGLVIMTLFLSGFATIFGIFYLKTRQNMAMIDKGMNPKFPIDPPAPSPYKNLKWALLLIGAGLGLFIAFMLDFHVLPQRYHTFNGNNYRDDHNTPIYFALIAVGGGLGLFGTYILEKKWILENRKEKSQREL